MNVEGMLTQVDSLHGSLESPLAAVLGSGRRTLKRPVYREQPAYLWGRGEIRITRAWHARVGGA